MHLLTLAMEYSTMYYNYTHTHVLIHTTWRYYIKKKYYFVLVRLNGFTMSSLVCWDDHISILAYLLHEDPLAMHVLCKYYVSIIKLYSQPKCTTDIVLLQSWHQSWPFDPSPWQPCVSLPPIMAGLWYVTYATMPCRATSLAKWSVGLQGSSLDHCKSLGCVCVCVIICILLLVMLCLAPDHCKIKGF